jgi:hypothetical protein
MAENKRVATFFLIILLIIGGFLAWLMLAQPEPQFEQVKKEVPNEVLFAD